MRLSARFGYTGSSVSGIDGEGLLFFWLLGCMYVYLAFGIDSGSQSFGYGVTFVRPAAHVHDVMQMKRARMHALTILNLTKCYPDFLARDDPHEADL